MSVWPAIQRAELPEIKKIRAQQLRTARHEAGHVFAAFLVDGFVCRSIHAFSDEGVASVNGSAAAACGGVVALEMFGDPNPRGGANSDLAYLASLPTTEQTEGWRLAREAMRIYPSAIDHFARYLISAGRLAGHEVRDGLIAALEHFDRQLTAAIAAEQGRTDMDDDRDFQHMVRHRSIAERLRDDLPGRPFSELWAAADELAMRNVEPEHAVKALEHIEAERSTGVIRGMASMEMVTRGRRR